MQNNTTIINIADLVQEQCGEMSYAMQEAIKSQFYMSFFMGIITGIIMAGIIYLGYKRYTRLANEKP